MSHRVEVQSAALKALAELPDDVRVRVKLHIEALAIEPRPPGIGPIRGQPPGNYRLRVGDYRIAFAVDDSACIVEVWQIGHRSGFYDKARRRRN